MSELGDAFEEIKDELGGAAEEFMPDLCDLIAPVKADQGAGHTISDSTLATNIPCHVKQSDGRVQIVANGVVETATHEIKMPVTTATLLIDRHYKIKVLERGTQAQMFFEHPVSTRGSTTVFISKHAVLKEGYQQPGIT